MVRTGERAERVLVTGGSGFIGSHLCARLIAEGRRVRVVDLRAPAVPVAGVEYRHGDIRDEACVASLLEGVGALYHLAAVSSIPLCEAEPLEGHRTNVLGTVAVLEAIRRHGAGTRLIFASSSAVYGDRGKRGEALQESVALAAPTSLYAAQKQFAETLIRHYREKHGLRAVVFRPFNVYGPGQDPRSPYSGVICRFASLIAAGRPLELNGGGVQTRDFVAVRDVVAALVAVFRAPAGVWDAAPMNLGCGKAVSVRELADAMMRAAGRQVPRIVTPPRGGDLLHSRAGLRAVKRRLRWRPEVDLEDGLRELFAGEIPMAA